MNLKEINMNLAETSVPGRESDASWRLEGLIFDVYDQASHRIVHLQGPHYGQCGLEQESVFSTQSSLTWLEDLFSLKKEWTVNELLRAEGSLAGEVIDYYVRRFDLTLEGARVLELGCGLGASTIQLLHQRPSQVVAVDIDPVSLEMARSRLEDHYPAADVAFIQTAVDDDLPVANGAFDVVAAFEVLEHVCPSRRGPLIRELYGKLRPGGCLLIASPNRLSPKDLHTTGLWFINYTPTPIAARYARLMSSRCRKRTTEQLISAGLVAFSWWQARSALRDSDAIDLAMEIPMAEQSPPTSSAAGRRWNYAMRVLSRLPAALLRWPQDAFAAHLFLAFRRPTL